MKSNKKMIVILASAVGFIVLLIIVLMLLAGNSSNKKLSYAEIEDKVITAGKNYYNDHESLLPSSGSASISIDKLVEAGYINKLSRYTGKDVTCSGDLMVTAIPNGYSYRTKLNCGGAYQTKTLSEKLLENGTVTVSNGLYAVEQVNPDNGNLETVHIFRGDNVNNYIKVGDFYWQVIKIYNDGTIEALAEPQLLEAIWDDRFNIDSNTYDGINNYEVSRIRDFIISDVVEIEDGFLKIKNLITTHTACIGKRYLDDTSKDGSAECSETLSDQYFSLLPAYDFINASLDANCNSANNDSCYNYNYLTSYSSSWWTITGVADRSNRVYYVSNILESGIANRNRKGRLLVHLDPSVMYVSGSGTYEDPYIVK